jgi:hypothetical protein
MLHFDAFANKQLSTVRLEYISTYVHIDVVVKSSQMSIRHEIDVKFRFINLFGITANKLDIKIMYGKPL